MIGLLGSMMGARGGRMLGSMIGGRTGAMVGGMLGSLVGSRQLGRLARSVMDGRNGDDNPGRSTGSFDSGGDFDDAGAGNGALTEESAGILVELMCNSAKADGAIDDDEAKRIASQIGDDVTNEEREFLRTCLTSPMVPAGIMAAKVPADLTAEAYAVSLLSIDLDHRDEHTYLDELAAGLGLNDTVRHEIHQELGISAP